MFNFKFERRNRSGSVCLETTRKFFSEANIKSVDDMHELIKDGNKYAQYVKFLKESHGFSDDENLDKLMSRQREVILESTSSDVNNLTGFLVTTPLIIFDTYAITDLYKIPRIEEIKTPKLSITRVKGRCKYRSIKTGRIVELSIPRVYNRFYDNYLEILVQPGVGTQLFGITVPGGVVITEDRFLISYGFTKITEINITNTSTGDTINLKTHIKTDGRGNIDKVIETDDFELRLFGHINNETGVLTLNYTMNPNNFVVDNVKFKVKYLTKSDNALRPEVFLRVDTTDISIDPIDDFKIIIPPELTQDMTVLYNVDIATKLLNACISQLSMSVEQKIVDELEDNVEDILDYGNVIDMDVKKYFNAGGVISPPDVDSVLTYVIFTAVLRLIRQIYKNSGYMLSHLVCNSRVGALLEYLAISGYFTPYDISDRRGKEIFKEIFAGLRGYPITVHITDAVNSDTIYAIGKYDGHREPEILTLDDRFAFDPMVCFEYQPVYIIREVTRGITRYSVRARKYIGIGKHEALGIIRIEDLDELMS